MPGLARHRPAIGAIICLGSLAVDGAPAQAPGAVDRTAGYDAARGESVYTTYCAACHGANGEGRSGMYPPIKGSGVVTKEDATKHIRVVLDGLHGAKAGGVLYTDSMPPFGGILSDVDAANVIDYERSSWGNHGKLVAAAEVAAQRVPAKSR
jgi:cytochrome c oxidase cbb3-type subunit 2